MKPKHIVDSIEKGGELPGGKEDRFVGYGVMGVPFSSGHILAMRRFPVNSLGAGYTSVWHRNPQGEWTFVQDVPPQRACSRYFGSAVDRSLQEHIEINWASAYDFTVTIADDYPMIWRVSLEQTRATEIMNTIGSRVPQYLWRNETVLELLGKVGGVVFGSGQLKLTGRVPNGQKFIANPKYVWMISSSSATVAGEDVGEMGPLAQQVHLGDLWLPQAGRFFIGTAYLEAFDSNRHIALTQKAA
jgi:hypothetical protein